MSTIMAKIKDNGSGVVASSMPGGKTGQSSSDKHLVSTLANPAHRTRMPISCQQRRPGR